MVFWKYQKEKRCLMDRNRKQTMTLVIVLILAALIIAGAVLLGAAVLLILHLNRQDPRLENAEEVIAYLQEQGEELGYRNAMSELTEANTQTLEENTYYRLQQNYRGIPVVGRNVVYVTDSRGNPLAVTRNVLDIPEDLNLTPSLQTGDAIRETAQFLWPEDPDSVVPLLAELALEEENLCIYSLNGTPTLAYEVSVSGLELVLDAHTGQVLNCHEAVVEAVAVFQDSRQTVNVPMLQDGSYILKDETTGTYIYSAGGNPYWTTDTNIFGQTVNKFAKENLTLVSSPDTTFGDGNDSVSSDSILRAQMALNCVNGLRDFYTELSGEAPFERLILIYDDSMALYRGKNACGGWIKPKYYVGGNLPDLSGDDKKEKAGLIAVGAEYSQDFRTYADVVAHEYTHVVSKKTVGWTRDSLENGALDEAFADIFGELYELRVLGTVDWINGGRTIYLPSERGFPEIANPNDVRNYYEWYVVPNFPRATDYSHYYTTVVSHIAYKMYTGADTLKDSAIPAQKLEKLWYSAMLMLPPDADFADCRTAVTMAAEIMGLSENQRQNITDAFDAAGIPDIQAADVIYELDETCTLTVYGRDSLPCTHYQVRVDTPERLGKLPSERLVLQAELEEGEVCVLKLDKGTYWITLRDLSGSGGEVFFGVEVTKDGLTELPVYTDFGPLPEPEELPPIVQEEEQPTPPAKLPVSNELEAYYDTILWDRSYTDEEGIKWVNYSYEYVQLRGRSDVVKIINEVLCRDAEKFMTAMTQERIETPVYYYGTDMRVSCTQTAETRVQHNGDGIFAVSIHVEEYGGGSQTLMWNYGFVFDLATGEQLTLQQLVGLDGEALDQELRRITWDYINRTQMVWDDAEKQLRHYSLEDFDFSIRDGQIYLYINNAYSLVFTQSGSISFPSGWYISELRGK